MSTLTAQTLRFLICALLLLSSVSPAVEANGTPQVGKDAPDFALKDQNGKTVRLADFRGKKSVVLAFYVKDFTGG